MLPNLPETHLTVWGGEAAGINTNVPSELLRSAPEPMVLAWLAAHPSESLFVSAVTQAELH